jgi:hypothetical protein
MRLSSSAVSEAASKPCASLRFNMAPTLRLILCLACLADPRPASAAPSVEPYFPVVYTDESIIVLFEGGPGNIKDWIGIYPSGEVPDGDPASTVWAYVDNTQNGLAGLREGSVTFLEGLPTAGEWAIYFLLDDGYVTIATNFLTVLDRGQPLVRPTQRTFTARDPVRISFSGGPGNPKDWIGIYRQGQVPGTGTPVLRLYVDGTPDGIVGQTDGTINFTTGLTEPGAYDVHFLFDDGFDILSSASFEILPGTPVEPRILSLSPPNGTTNLPPRLTFSAVFTNGTTQIVPDTVALTLDGAVVPAIVTAEPERVSVAYTNTSLPASGPHTWVLTARDNGAPPLELREESTVSVGPYVDLQLPQPLHFLDFDDVPEGTLPAGWTQQSYSFPLNPAEDFADLASAAYARWTTVNAERFEGLLAIYGDPANLITEYRRVLSVNLFNVVNGEVYDEPLARGRFLFGNSGYQDAIGSQVLYLFTPDFDLTGRTGVHLGFKSVWEQNDDSIAAIEYSIDRGNTWLPIAYFLEGPDIVTLPNGTVDAVATLTAEHSDVALYIDDLGNEIGGQFGAFIAAPISSALAPYIQARVDDNPVESKRIELFPIPMADNQPAVRFRFAHAGADSWYFGIDDLGLYSIAVNGGGPRLTVLREPGAIVINWSAAPPGVVLETTAALGAAPWQAVSGVTGTTHRVPITDAAAFFRLRQ